MQLQQFADVRFTAHPFCHPEGNVFCHAGTGAVKR